MKTKKEKIKVLVEFNIEYEPQIAGAREEVIKDVLSDLPWRSGGGGKSGWFRIERIEKSAKLLP